MTTDFRARPEFLRGRAGERVVAAWLMKRGCYVIPSYDYGGEDGDKAPALQGLWTGHPVPDLDVSHGGNRFWVEVKTKREPTFHRISGTYQHGINNRLIKHYREVQSITGCPCWLFIYEELSCWLLGELLDVLGMPRVAKCFGTPMAYWPRERFRELEQITNEEATA
jgi:hypothetical protein